MKTKKIVALLCIIAIGSFSSCKKKTSDPEPEPDVTTPVIPVNQLCDGTGGVSYFPLDSTNAWIYLLKISGQTQASKPSPKVTGFVTYNSIKYAHYYDLVFQTDQYYRENTSTHNVYYYKSPNTEFLEVPGTPTLNQTWTSAYGTRTVTNLNASKTTSSCTYTGLLEITEVIGAKTTKFYYKKGLGQVYRIDVSGTSFPGEYTLTSATLK